MQFAELIKQQGFTQDKLANVLKVSQPCVYKWCCGKSMPKRENFLKLAKVLNVAPLSLVACFLTN